MITMAFQQSHFTHTFNFHKIVHTDSGKKKNGLSIKRLSCVSSFAHHSTDLTLSWFGVVLVPLKCRWCENVATGFSSAEWLPRGLHQLGVKPERQWCAFTHWPCCPRVGHIQYVSFLNSSEAHFVCVCPYLSILTLEPNPYLRCSSPKFDPCLFCKKQMAKLTRKWSYNCSNSALGISWKMDRQVLAKLVDSETESNKISLHRILSYVRNCVQ